MNWELSEKQTQSCSFIYTLDITPLDSFTRIKDPDISRPEEIQKLHKISRENYPQFLN